MSTKKCYRFYAGMMGSQARFLNRMAAEGYRLVHTDKMSYEFETCAPGAYEYCVEYVGNQSSQHAGEYKRFLEDLGYRTFYKNINLNYSAGKVYYRPAAEKGGRIGTASSTLNKELLIVEKPRDGKPFELHSTYEDKIKYMKILQGPWLFTAAIFLILWLVLGIFRSGSPLLGVFALLMLIPVLLYQLEISRLKRESKTKEW